MRANTLGVRITRFIIKSKVFTSYTYLAVGYAALSTWFFALAQNEVSILNNFNWLVTAAICLFVSALIALILNRYHDKVNSIRLGAVIGLFCAAIVLWFDFSKIINNSMSALVLVAIVFIPFILGLIVREKKSKK